MKRYLAFFGHNFYPNGGMGDFLSDHHNLDDAREAILSQYPPEWDWDNSWGHVYDTVNKEIVYKK